MNSGDTVGRGDEQIRLTLNDHGARAQAPIIRMQIEQLIKFGEA